MSFGLQSQVLVDRHLCFHELRTLVYGEISSLRCPGEAFWSSTWPRPRPRPHPRDVIAMASNAILMDPFEPADSISQRKIFEGMTGRVLWDAVLKIYTEKSGHTLAFYKATRSS